MLNLFTKIPIFHIASMARSGETVLLRSLAAHSRIQIVHNLEKQETENSIRLFNYLKNSQDDKIGAKNKYAKHCCLKKGEILLLKQGVWEHKYDFNGIILSRNPISIFASLKVYDEDGFGNGNDWQRTWLLRNTERLSRWLKDIDAKLLYGFDKLSPIDQFCLFYNRRMGGLIKTNKPILYYENFVENPEKELRFLISEMGLQFENAVLKSHKKFKKGEEGHGKNDLSQPIKPDSLLKYKAVITKEEFQEINEKTSNVSKLYGYNVNWNKIELSR